MSAGLRALTDDELSAYAESSRHGYATSIEEHGSGVARNLYRSLGYEESAVWMGKDIA